MPVAAGTPVVNVAAPTFKANPWSICAELRAQQPVVRVPMPGGLREGYLITRYEGRDSGTARRRTLCERRPQCP